MKGYYRTPRGRRGVEMTNGCSRERDGVDVVGRSVCDSRARDRNAVLRVYRLGRSCKKVVAMRLRQGKGRLGKAGGTAFQLDLLASRFDCWNAVLPGSGRTTRMTSTLAVSVSS